MQKINNCKSCGSRVYTYKCDVCGNKFNEGIPITIDFGYGSELDGEQYNFCNMEEAIQFLIDESKKTKIKSASLQGGFYE